MRFVYLCIVTVISCSVCASGDLEIYPGVKFSFDDDQRSRPRRFDHSAYYSKLLFPFQSLPPSEYESGGSGGEFPQYERIPDRADKIRQYKEVTDWNKYHSRSHNKHRQHPDLPSKYDFSNFDINIPLLNVAWQNDRFPVDEREDQEEGKSAFEQAEQYGHLLADKLIFNQSPHSSHIDSHVSHHSFHSGDEIQNGNFDSGRFRNAKVVDDPTDFAYAPPDPRFYRKIDDLSETDAPTTENQNENLQTTSSADMGLKVIQRSELNSLESEVDHTGRTDVKTSQRNEGVEMVAVQPSVLDADSAGVYVIAIVAGISAAATVGLIAVGIGWYNLQKHVKNASDVDYPAYGVTGPNKDCSPSGERRLAESAQMYHYQHQKQQIIAMARASPSERNGSISDAESDEENEEGDYTVYECPGLAPTGEMEVKNPLFQDDPTPAQTPATKSNNEEMK